ncbi:uncharacterized protein LOC127565752 [Drosophila albomicans]|uniref:Uncharacterized protein LOC127565752 n=1 Tax=Drosophila albomicans TaxID=7291 RepID=A0A9C6WJK3_DROAB|nr:uncharacterized protein LOC127565752 [Drosophila albomicans]
MKMVQLEAENLYAEQPKEKEYFVATYEKCQPIVSEQYNTLMTSPPAKAALKPMCRPFFSLLHLCFMEYHKKNECPYFRWQKNGKSEESTACKQARNKCYEIDGIRPHESHTRNV